MGKSEKIKTVYANDKDFQNYLARIEVDLKNKSAQVHNVMHIEIDKFQAKSRNETLIALQGANIDVFTDKEFSLTNLKRVVDAIKKSVLSESEVANYAQLNEGAKDAKANDSDHREEKLNEEHIHCLATRVYQVLAGKVEGLAAETSDGVMPFASEIVSEYLGFGFQLFAAITVDSYRASDFFRNEYVVQYLYVYEIHQSLKLLKEDARTFVKEDYIELMDKATEALAKLQDDFAKGTVTDEAYDRRLKRFLESIDNYQKKIHELELTRPGAAAHAFVNSKARHIY